MGTLKYALLGMLSRKSLTGYEISKQFESSLCEFWQAKHSQIYPELKALTNADLIEFKVQISGNVMEKKVYSITEKGRQEFLQWAEKDITALTVPKDEFRLQLYFSDGITPKRRIELLQKQLELHKKYSAYLTEKIAGFGDIDTLSEDDFCNYMVMQSGVLREQYMCSWLKNCIRMCKKKL